MHATRYCQISEIAFRYKEETASGKQHATRNKWLSYDSVSARNSPSARVNANGWLISGTWPERGSTT